jgi:hypothetical protein
MFNKTVIPFLFLAAVSLGASAQQQNTRLTKMGEPSFFKLIAKASAKKHVRQECQKSGGTVVSGSTFVTYCQSFPTSGQNQCVALCECSF